MARRKTKLAPEIGTTGFNHQAGYLDEEWHNSLRGNEADRKYREMSDNNGLIGAWSAMQEFLVRQTPIRFEPQEGNTTKPGETWAQFANEAWSDMQTAPDEVLSEAMSSTTFGHAELELTWKVRRGQSGNPKLCSKYSDGKIGYADMAIRSQETIHRYEIDDHGKLMGIYQMAPPAYQERFIPMTKIIQFVPRRYRGLWRSMLRSSVRNYEQLKVIEDYEAVGVEKNMGGVLDMQIPVDCFGDGAHPDAVKTRQNFEKFIQRAHRGEFQGFVRPAEVDRDGQPTEYKLDVLGNGGNRLVDTDPIIRRKESRLLIALLSESLIMGVDKHGSFAALDVKGDFLLMFIGAMLKMICTALNKAFADLCFINGCPEKHIPIAIHGDISRMEPGVLGSFISQMVSTEVLAPGPKLAEYAVRAINAPMEIVAESWPKDREVKIPGEGEPVDEQSQEQEQPDEEVDEGQQPPEPDEDETT